MIESKDEFFRGRLNADYDRLIGGFEESISKAGDTFAIFLTPADGKLVAAALRSARIAREFRVGDIVETTKGAKFWGVVIAVYVTKNGKPGCVVEAVAAGFEGVVHVYPELQLSRRNG